MAEEYDKLDSNQKETYDLAYNNIKRQHPDWDEERLKNSTLLSVAVLDTINDGGIDIPKPPDGSGVIISPDIMEQILKGAKATLIRAGIVMGTVLNAIDRAIDRVCDAIERGAKWVWGKITDIWHFLFS